MFYLHVFFFFSRKNLNHILRISLYHGLTIYWLRLTWYSFPMPFFLYKIPFQNMFMRLPRYYESAFIYREWKIETFVKKKTVRCFTENRNLWSYHAYHIIAIKQIVYNKGKFNKNQKYWHNILNNSCNCNIAQRRKQIWFHSVKSLIDKII